MATHPIQYQVPWFQALSRLPGLEVKVYYALLPDEVQQGTGFGVAFKWDLPMLDGYEWEVLPNARRYPSLSGFFGSSTPSIGAAFARRRPDVVLITGWNSYSLVQSLWASFRRRIPAIVRGESNAMRRRAAWKRLLHHLFLARFSAFLAIGKSNRAFYENNGVDSARIFDCRYFVDNERIRTGFGDAMRKRADLRAKWDVPEDSFCFLYVGKLEPKKRILDLIDALQIAIRTPATLHLLVVGSGELMVTARKRSDTGKLPVSFTGFLNQTELPDAYACGDCLVLPSDEGETWGLVVNEAMVCGLPAIVSDRVGCGPDLVEEGVTGAIFPLGDVGALASCMARLSADSAGARTMGARAQERVQRYSVHEATIGTMQAIEFVAGRAPRA